MTSRYTGPVAQGLSIIALITLLPACATAPPPAPEPQLPFVETYTGSGPDGLSMKLQMLKPVPTAPQSGWLNEARVATADAKFGGVTQGPVKYALTPALVAFQADQSGKFPPGRYYWEGGVLNVC